jgi:hypothetical protein
MKIRLSIADLCTINSILSYHLPDLGNLGKVTGEYAHEKAIDDAKAKAFQAQQLKEIEE